MVGGDEEVDPGQAGAVQVGVVAADHLLQQKAPYLNVPFFLIRAAIDYDPDKAGGMDAALSTVRDQPFGTVSLVIMALGIAAFGVYCFIWAKRARY